MLTKMTDVTVLLADDHAMVRMGFRLLLEGAGAQVVAEGGSGEDVLRVYTEHQPRVVVLDVSMPGMGGLAALERLRARHPEARVLVLSAHTDPQTPIRALRAGAYGYLCKRCRPDDFLCAVQRVARGERYLDPEMAPRVALAQLAGGHPAEALTDKEFSVFLQLAQGRSVSDVARDLHLSASTVGTHLYHIKQKLSVANSAELTLIALRTGLLEA